MAGDGVGVDQTHLVADRRSRGSATPLAAAYVADQLSPRRLVAPGLLTGSERPAVTRE